MRLLTFLSRRRIVLTLALLLCTVPVWAGDGPLERASLKGITSLQALIEPVQPDAERDGLPTSQLEADIELRLRRAGIKVVPLATEVLHVHVNTVKHPDGLVYAFNVSVVFYQVVVPLRDIRNQTSLPAVTWSVALVGVVPTGKLRDVRAEVADLVDQFITAYREQNPKP
ncbi:MAG: hypothetical protein A2Y78_03875 [Acidobacteria bacterium RBG_13_68_16]|jgi:hypothetical protein|nr:MAG: hypothetical protein A2Y78_03875 [Acidobacteria bacterium RBG_13_68_16]